MPAPSPSATELLLDQLGIDENKWRVGKTLVFLKDYEIMDQLDKLREEKIVEYVIILQSYFRMCKDLQFFRRFRRKVCRIQGYIKTQVIREAFEEVCQATRVVQKYARRRIYYNVYQQIKEEFKPKEAGEDMDLVKAREGLHKLLTKLNPALNFFAPDGGEEGARRAGGKKGDRRASAAARGARSLGEDPSMPRFRNRHKQWLTGQVRQGQPADGLCLHAPGHVHPVQGRGPRAAADLVRALADGARGAGSQVTLSQPMPTLAALKAAKTVKKGAKKGEEPAPIPIPTEEIVLFPPTEDKEGTGVAPAEKLATFKKKLEDGIAEAKTLDFDLNLNFNLGVDVEAKPEDSLEVVTEGYLHTKLLQLDEGQSTDARTVKRAWDHHKEGWARAYFVLLNNGKLKYYESAGAAGMPVGKRVEMGEINLRLFAVTEVEEAFDAAEAAADEKKAKEKAGKKGAAPAAGGNSKGSKVKPVEMKIEGEFYSLVKGKQFELRNGRLIFRLASGVPSIAEEWLNTLTATTTTMYQKSPIFPQNYIKVHLLNGETSKQLINENTVCVNLVKRMCKESSINNDEQWGLYELWDHPDIPGMPGMRERKVPNMESLLDQTMLKWEVATRIRHGMVAAMPENSFKLVLRKASSLTPNTRSKEELALEYNQAMQDFKGGLFALEEKEGNKEGRLSEDESEVWDMAACAAFKDAFDKRLQEASAAEEEGGLTAERSRELQRMLETSITDMEPSDLDGQESLYLPEAWFADGEPSKPKLLEWRKKICERFHELLVEEIIDTGDDMCLTRRLLYDYRMEADPNAYAMMSLFVDRIRRSPKCFAMQFMAHLWSQDRTHAVVLQVNYLGLHIYTPGESQTLLASFAFYDSLVSWLALNDMLTVHVVHQKMKRSAKIHLLTRETMQVKTLLTKYADAVLIELQKIDKERALRRKVEDANRRNLEA